MRTFLRYLAIAYIIYLAIALVIITPLLNFLPHKYVKDTYGRELQTKWVLLNPFKLSLDVREAALSETGGDQFVSFADASVNLSLEGLWQTGWVLDQIRLKDLTAEVVRLSDSEFNFSDLLASDVEEAETETTESAIPGVTIHDLQLHSKEIVVADNTREKPYSSSWKNLSIHVLDLSTVLEEGRPYNIDVYGEGGGHLSWEGTVSIPGSMSEGHLSLTTLNLPAIWRIAEPWLQFEVIDGQLSVEGNYLVSWGDALSYKVTEGAVNVTALDIQPVDPQQLPETGIRLDSLGISNIALDSTTLLASIDSVDVEGLAVATWREGAEVSLQPLFAVDLPAEEPEPEAESAADSGDSWRASLNKISVNGSSVHWRSQLTDPPILEIQPVQATVENLLWPLEGDSKLALALAINGQSNISVDGILNLADGQGAINYSLDGLPLAWFNPNLPAALKAEFTGGEIQIAGQVALEEFAPTTISLDGAVENFAASRLATDATLTSWESVRLAGLNVNMVEHALVLQSLAIHSYSGRLHIAKDGSINASNVWQEEVGEQAEEIAEDLTGDKPWSFEVPQIMVTDSAIDFMDESLPISFRTVIGDLNGDIVGISSDPQARARVNMEGSVDGYAPVRLAGDMNPLSAPPAVDLELTFDGVDLAPLTPYSGTYAGYVIDQGLLNLDLQYSLQDNHLKGKNEVRIDQLKLGDKVDSDKAVDAPLELALAILTDANGVIDLSVPVEGDVDDPSFAIGSVVGKAFLNVITKIVTAPFSILAGLVGSEEDLQRLTFPSGSAELDEGGKAKLDQIASALAQRPNLSLVITGRLLPDADRERLQKNILREDMLETGVSEAEINSKGPAWEKAIIKRFNALPNAAAQAESTSPMEKYTLVVSSIAISETQLLELAEQRALESKRYLVVEAGMDGQRAVVGQTQLDDEKNSFSGVELGVDN